MRYAEMTAIMAAHYIPVCAAYRLVLDAQLNISAAYHIHVLAKMKPCVQTIHTYRNAI